MEVDDGVGCCLCSRKATSACGRCKLVNYCGPECQKEHWKIHKKLCGKEASVSNSSNGTSKRLVPLCGDAFRQWFEHNASVQVGIDHLETPPVGLRNLDSNCYLNAILQCLLHTPLLAKNLSTACSQQDDQWLRELAIFFLRVEMARDTGDRVSAAHIVDIVATNKEFARGNQADAHEAFMFILSKLLQACLKAGNGSHEDLTKIETYQAREAMERDSLIGHIFGMDLGQTVACSSCNYESFSTRIEYCLCISIALGLDDSMLESLMSKAGAPPIDITSLLHTHTQKHVIEGFRCENCGAKGGNRWECFKRRPNVLTIYIDRSKDHSKFGKIKRYVRVKERLDLLPYSHQSDINVASVDSYGYSLCAVVVHKDIGGSTSCGHYVAYVRDKSREWFLVDDLRVEKVSWERVQSQEVYLLLYAADVPAPPAAGRFSVDGCPESSPQQHPQESLHLVCSEQVCEATGVTTTDNTLPSDANGNVLTPSFFDFDDLDALQKLPLG